MVTRWFKNFNKGFTLIELLVVIAIIAIVSVSIQVTYVIAMAKSRDADRISDMKRMATLLTEISVENETLLFDTPCDVADTSTTNCTGAGQPGNIENEFPKFIDPSFSTIADANASPCTGADTAPCQYSIESAGSNISDVVIQFYLERDVDELLAGPHTMTSTGEFN